MSASLQESINDLRIVSTPCPYRFTHLILDPDILSPPSQTNVSFPFNAPVSSPAATVNGFAVEPGS